MGLDIVEIIMRAEETFNIDIPDDDAAQLETVGDIYRYVLQALDSTRPGRRAEGWSDEEVWETLKDMIVEETDLPPERIVPEADMVRDLHLD